MSGQGVGLARSNCLFSPGVFSEYLRSLINNAVPAAVDYRQDIAPVICKIYVRLQEMGLDEKDITKEVRALCQMLS